MACEGPFLAQGISAGILHKEGDPDVDKGLLTKEAEALLSKDCRAVQELPGWARSTFQRIVSFSSFRRN
jgi:hypothetical protein